MSRIAVRYKARYFVIADYARFEFMSPHQPPRRIPVSETGYRSYFAPMHEVEAAPNLGEYTRALALSLMPAAPQPDDGDEEPAQFDLF